MLASDEGWVGLDRLNELDLLNDNLRIDGESDK